MYINNCHKKRITSFYKILITFIRVQYRTCMVVPRLHRSHCGHTAEYCGCRTCFVFIVFSKSPVCQVLCLVFHLACVTFLIHRCCSVFAGHFHYPAFLTPRQVVLLLWIPIIRWKKKCNCQTMLYWQWNPVNLHVQRSPFSVVVLIVSDPSGATRSDQYLNSPYNSNMLSSRQVMRIKKIIN